ncbi:hypothetical protein [Microbacterium sp. SL75]|uniref:hypothetical protein n=1 Tax=Microbacterium sp. SL75 TaxID=2995140 RepID=UPI00226E5E1F|nr:hypothetical protein [Microbacterium sp. SL75]WAC69992.1 hypothetical protein OVA17_04680 [Microbacterium sp. SL75]
MIVPSPFRVPRCPSASPTRCSRPAPRLKAALAAIEVKANAPRRASEAVERKVQEVRRKAQQNPGAAAAVVAGVASLVGLAVWGIVRAYTR